MQVTLDKPYMSNTMPAFKMNLAKSTEELLSKNVNTRKLNMIKNGLASKGFPDTRVLIEEFPDMALLSKIDFSKFNGKNFETTELGRGRNLNDVVKKLVEFAKS